MEERCVRARWSSSGRTKRWPRSSSSAGCSALMAQESVSLMLDRYRLGSAGRRWGLRARGRLGGSAGFEFGYFSLFVFGDAFDLGGSVWHSASLIERISGVIEFVGVFVGLAQPQPSPGGGRERQGLLEIRDRIVVFLLDRR